MFIYLLYMRVVTSLHILTRAHIHTHIHTGLLHFDIFISKFPKLRFIRIRKQMGFSIHLLGLLQ